MPNTNEVARREGQLPHPNTKGLPANISKDISTVLSEEHHDKLVSVFGQIFAGVQVSREFLKSIDKSVTYIAKIPKHLEKAFTAGDLHFMVKNDTGEQLGAIVGADKMNRGFVRIEEATPVATNLAASLTNLAMQQQLAQIAAVINEVRSRVVELKTIHDRDLLGSLRGMHAQLEQIKITTKEPERTQLTTSAITVLNSTLGKIEQRLLDELERFPDIPANEFVFRMKVFFTTDYYAQLEQSYELIQELFDYYLSGLQMLAYAYAFLGEESVSTSVFIPPTELCNNNNLQKVARAENRCVGKDLGVTWYKAPEEYLQRISLEAKQLFEKEQDQLFIEITGEQMLEVLSDVERSGEQE